jgi:hypothetical protein
MYKAEQRIQKKRQKQQRAIFVVNSSKRFPNIVEEAQNGSAML